MDNRITSEGSPALEMNSMVSVPGPDRREFSQIVAASATFAATMAGDAAYDVELIPSRPLGKTGEKVSALNGLISDVDQLADDLLDLGSRGLLLGRRGRAA